MESKQQMFSERIAWAHQQKKQYTWVSFPYIQGMYPVYVIVISPPLPRHENFSFDVVNSLWSSVLFSAQ